jgi:Zn-dependent protease
MRLIGCKAQKLQITPLGMIIDYTHTFRSYEQDLWVFLAGPFANILLFCFFRNCSFWQLNLFSTINLSYAVLNLLPVYSLDGGCALEAILSLHLTSQAVEKTLFVSSFLVITALWIGSIWELFTFANGYSLFAFCVWLFISLFLK